MNIHVYILRCLYISFVEMMDTAAVQPLSLPASVRLPQVNSLRDKSSALSKSMTALSDRLSVAGVQRASEEHV